MNRGVVRKAAAVDQLDAFVIDGRVFRGPVDALQAACVNQRAGRRTAGFHMLYAAVANDGAARVARELLRAAEKNGVRRRTAEGHVLNAAVAHHGAVGMTAGLHQLHTAVFDSGVVGRAVDILQTAAVDRRAHGKPGRFDMLLCTGIDLGV